MNISEQIQKKKLGVKYMLMVAIFSCELETLITTHLFFTNKNTAVIKQVEKNISNIVSSYENS